MKRAVFIKGNKWNFKRVLNLTDDVGNECHGLCDFAAKLISIDKETIKSGPFKKTLVHELVHAVLDEHKISLPRVTEERICDAIADEFVSLFSMKLK